MGLIHPGPSITERQRQLALLRIVGATATQIRWSIYLEALAFAALGTVLGISLGIVGSRFLSSGMVDLFGLKESPSGRIQLHALLAGVVFGPLVTLIAVWYGLIWIGLAAAIGRSIPALRGMPGIRSESRIHSVHSLSDLWMIVLSFMLLHSVYWTDTRMRTPVMPFICIIAAVGWRSMFIFVSSNFTSKASTGPGT